MMRLEREREEEFILNREDISNRAAMLTPEQEKVAQMALSDINIVKLSDYTEWFACLDRELKKLGL